MFLAFQQSDFALSFLSLFIEGAPYILLGTLISGFIDVYMPSSLLEKGLPKNKFLAILTCGFMGLILPVCECAVVPVIRRLVAKGLPVSCAFTYMLAAPILNPITIWSTWHAFNEQDQMWNVISRCGMGYAVAIIVGLIVMFLPLERVIRDSVLKTIRTAPQSKKDDDDECCGHDHDTCDHDHSKDHYHGCSHDHSHDHEQSDHEHTHECGHEHAKEHKHTHDCGHEHDHSHDHKHSDHKHTHECDHDHAKEHNHGTCGHDHDEVKGCGHDHNHSDCDHDHGLEKNRIVSAMRSGLQDAVDVGVYFTIGVCLAAMFNILYNTNQESLSSILANPAAETGGMMFLAFLLSVCSTSDAFMAATYNFVGAGAKMSFMVLGPMLDVKLLFLYQTVMRKKFLLFFTIFLFLLVGVMTWTWEKYEIGKASATKWELSIKDKKGETP